MSDFVVLGGTGQLGKAVTRALGEHGSVVSVGHKECDISCEDSVRMHVLADCRLVVNCAAIHDGRECENSPGRSWYVNSDGAMDAAHVARFNDARYCYISTDMVFDGVVGNGTFCESDPIQPASTYSRSKAAGEMATLMFGGFVVRLATIFGTDTVRRKPRPNFIDQVVINLRANQEMQVTNVRRTSCTYAADAAELIVRLGLSEQKPQGVYHGANAGNATYYEIADYVASCVDPQKRSLIVPVDGELGSTPIISERVMSRPWTDAVLAYLQAKGAVDRNKGESQ